MLVLGAVVAVLVVSYASSMKAYLQQRSQINTLTTQIADSGKEISRLETEKKRWNSRSYVEVQARERFGWVMPGETAYQVLGKDGKPLDSTDTLTDPSSVVPSTKKSWFAREYESLQNADRPATAKPAPATSITPADE